MFMFMIGVVLLAVGLWEIFIAKKTFAQIKAGKVKTSNGFMPWALWTSLAIGIILAFSSVICFISALRG